MFLLNVRIFPIFIFILLLASTMSSDAIEVRVLLRHYWKKGLSQRKAVDKINEVEGTTSKSAAGRWFKRFDDGDLSLEDKPRSGRPTKLDDENKSSLIQSQESSTSTRSGILQIGGRKL